MTLDILLKLTQNTYLLEKLAEFIDVKTALCLRQVSTQHKMAFHQLPVYMARQKFRSDSEFAELISQLDKNIDIQRPLRQINWRINYSFEPALTESEFEQQANDPVIYSPQIGDDLNWLQGENPPLRPQEQAYLVRKKYERFMQRSFAHFCARQRQRQGLFLNIECAIRCSFMATLIGSCRCDRLLY